MRVAALLIIALVSIAGKASEAAVSPMIPPSSTVEIRLPNGAYIHMLPLPLGRLNGAIRGAASFERGGSRCVFLAVFPGATLDGDWRRLDPVQAFILDPRARTLAQLSGDGAVRAVAWTHTNTVRYVDSTGEHDVDVGANTARPLPPLRLAAPEGTPAGDTIGEAGNGRLIVSRTAGGRYRIEQIGARALRFEGVAPEGAYALIGNFLVWADHGKLTGGQVARGGPDALSPPLFAGSAFGDAIVPIVPLGHAVYQGGYRNGVVYFAFTYGVKRIVASTDDLTTYRFPALPAEPEFTVGDGLGGDNGGHPYFARPEDGRVAYWRAGRYVRERLRMPAGNGKSAALFAAMQRLAPEDPLWPPLRPDEDALDNALLQWRFYPVGDASGDRWLASYLGRVMLAGRDGVFRYVVAPQFPFAVLGRTDDGRLWGAAPAARAFLSGRIARSGSVVSWSRDGVHWHEAARLEGDVGAVGLDLHATVWFALTKPWFGRAAIFAAPLGSGVTAAFTGGTYDGEQLFFASLRSGMYLIWGATPGQRLGGEQGTLSAYRIDRSALFSDAGRGLNSFAEQVLYPADDPSLPGAAFDVEGGNGIVAPTLSQLLALLGPSHGALVTNAAGVSVDPARVTLLGFDQARAFDIKYAGRPYPIGSVQINRSGGAALVTRSLRRGPLSFDGTSERWAQSTDGRWRRSAILSRWQSDL
ncbi:MAG: hypothetical protein DLM53_09430 [Candidatus Eremiobacter antarcticus]|nr:MAG: hypothetical protein DLM53_09430 [Candidatus Eremiobacter sp. RRmetagenome_bin22]